MHTTTYTETINKMTKIKIAQNKNKARVINHFELIRLEKQLAKLIDERNDPFLL